MTLFIDTREQKALEFNHPYITEVKRKKLIVGDYACQFNDGHVPPVYFERKSIPDLYQTLTKGNRRFKRELVRAWDNDITLILIIEGSYSEVRFGNDETRKYSEVNGEQIIQTLQTFFRKHGLFFFCCKSRVEMARYITDYYVACGKEYMRRKKEKEVLEETEIRL